MTCKNKTGKPEATRLPTELPRRSFLQTALAGGAVASTAYLSLTRDLVAKARGIISVVGFWDNATRQDDLRKSIKQTLDASDLFNYDSLDELAVELVALAKANQHRLR